MDNKDLLFKFVLVIALISLFFTGIMYTTVLDYNSNQDLNNKIDRLEASKEDRQTWDSRFVGIWKDEHNVTWVFGNRGNLQWGDSPFTWEINVFDKLHIRFSGNVDSEYYFSYSFSGNTLKLNDGISRTLTKIS